MFYYTKWSYKTRGFKGQFGKISEGINFIRSNDEEKCVEEKGEKVAVFGGRET